MRIRLTLALAALAAFAVTYASLGVAGDDKGASYGGSRQAEGQRPGATYGDDRQAQTADTAAAPSLNLAYVGRNGGYFLGRNGTGNVISRGRYDFTGVHLANTLTYAGQMAGDRVYEIVGWKKNGQKTWHRFPIIVPPGQFGIIGFGVGDDYRTAAWEFWDDATMAQNQGNMK